MATAGQQQGNSKATAGQQQGNSRATTGQQQGNSKAKGRVTAGKRGQKQNSSEISR
jgi:hypothetical protein